MPATASTAPTSTHQPRNIIQLIADYGVGISSLYRAQLREVERTVLGKL